MTTEALPKRINRANYLREIDATINNKRDIPYTMIDNSILREKKLSWSEKGLLSYLLHLENGKSIKKTTLFENSENGRDGTIAIFDKLVEKAYIIPVKHITNDGKYLWEYFVYNKPQESASGANGAIPEMPQRLSPTGDAPLVNQETYISNSPSIEGKRIKSKPPTPKGDELVFPDSWTAEMEYQFKDVWLVYRQNKKNFRNLLRADSIQKQVENLADFDLYQLRDCITASISNGYQGLFPDKFRGKRPQTAPIQQPAQNQTQVTLFNPFEYNSQEEPLKTQLFLKYKHLVGDKRVAASKAKLIIAQEYEDEYHLGLDRVFFALYPYAQMHEYTEAVQSLIQQ